LFFIHLYKDKSETSKKREREENLPALNVFTTE